MRVAWIMFVLGCSSGAPRSSGAFPSPAASTDSGPVAATLLTAADRQRDAARTPLAIAAVDAFANVASSDLPDAGRGDASQRADRAREPARYEQGGSPPA